jgi:hypothetical protein
MLLSPSVPNGWRRHRALGAVSWSLLLTVSACKGSPESAAAIFDAGSPPDAVIDRIANDTERDSSREEASRSDAFLDGADARDPLTDESVWSRVDIGDSCELYEADLARAAFARRNWRACGPGCLVADAPVWGSFATLGDASASFRKGETFVRTSVKSPRGVLTHVSRVSDGATVAAVEQRGVANCIGLGGADAPLLLPYLIIGGRYVVGRVNAAVEPSRVGWPGSSVVQAGLRTCLPFGWEGGWGICFNDGTIRIVGSNAATTMTQIDAASVPAFSAAARNEMAVWSGWDGATQHYVVRAYTAATGTRALAAVDTGDVSAVALSDDRLVWTGIHGPLIGQGSYESAEIYSSPPAPTSDRIVATRGPSLPVSGGLMTLVTGGDFAATRGCVRADDGGSLCSVLVVQLSTGRLWKVSSRPGNVFNSVLAASSDEILLGEVDEATGDRYGLLLRLVRLSTSALDQIERGW